MCGAAFPNFDAASKVSGFAINALIVSPWRSTRIQVNGNLLEIHLANNFFPQTFIGYQQPKPDMHPWFVWIYWINPLSYGFESLMGNEFHDR
jgi:hypothetical protein